MSYYFEIRQARIFVDNTLKTAIKQEKNLSQEKLLYSLGLRFSVGTKLLKRIISEAVEHHQLNIIDDVILVVEPVGDDDDQAL